MSDPQIWYMRDNHTFRRLPMDVEGAIEAMREERDAGNTFGMLCCGGVAMRIEVVHAEFAHDWSRFEEKARPYLERFFAEAKEQEAQA
jgi:hypothetical protein